MIFCELRRKGRHWETTYSNLISNKPVAHHHNCLQIANNQVGNNRIFPAIEIFGILMQGLMEEGFE